MYVYILVLVTGMLTIICHGLVDSHSAAWCEGWSRGGVGESGCQTGGGDPLILASCRSRQGAGRTWGRSAARP